MIYSKIQFVAFFNLRVHGCVASFMKLRNLNDNAGLSVMPQLLRLSAFPTSGALQFGLPFHWHHLDLPYFSRSPSPSCLNLFSLEITFQMTNLHSWVALWQARIIILLILTGSENVTGITVTQMHQIFGNDHNPPSMRYLQIFKTNSKYIPRFGKFKFSVTPEHQE